MFQFVSGYPEPHWRKNSGKLLLVFLAKSTSPPAFNIKDGTPHNLWLLQGEWVEQIYVLLYTNRCTYRKTIGYILGMQSKIRKRKVKTRTDLGVR